MILSLWAAQSSFPKCLWFSTFFLSDSSLNNDNNNLRSHNLDKGNKLKGSVWCLHQQYGFPTALFTSRWAASWICRLLLVTCVRGHWFSTTASVLVMCIFFARGCCFVFLPWGRRTDVEVVLKEFKIDLGLRNIRKSSLKIIRVWKVSLVYFFFFYFKFEKKKFQNVLVYSLTFKILNQFRLKSIFFLMGLGWTWSLSVII